MKTYQITKCDKACVCLKWMDGWVVGWGGRKDFEKVGKMIGV